MPKGPSPIRYPPGRVALAISRIQSGKPGKFNPRDLHVLTVSKTPLSPGLREKVAEHNRKKEAEYAAYRRNQKRAGFKRNRERAIQNIRSAPAGRRLPAKDLLVLRGAKGLPADIVDKISAHRVLRKRENGADYKKRQRRARVQSAVAAVKAGVPGRLPRNALIVLSSAKGLPPSVIEKINEHRRAVPKEKKAYMRNWHNTQRAFPRLQAQIEELDADLKACRMGRGGQIAAKYARLLNDPESKSELSSSELEETEAKILLLRKRALISIDRLMQWAETRNLRLKPQIKQG